MLLRAIRSRVQYAVWHLRWRILLGLASRRTIHGIRVRAAAIFDADTVSRALDVVEAALNLIAKYDPRRLRRIAHDIDWIWIARTDYGTAYFMNALKMCVVDRKYLTVDEVGPARVSCTLVHEAIHARLFARNIPYAETLRPRIEAICSSQAAEFARKLPDGEKMAQWILEGLPNDPNHWSHENLSRRLAESKKVEREDMLKDIEGAELPAWIKRVLGRIVRSRAA